MANLRKRLNNWVKEKGNKYTPRLAEKGNGLGDILTLEINSCRKVGALAGAIVPSILAYNSNDSISYNLIKEVVVYGTVIFPMATAFAGYTLGGLLDELFGEKTLKELNEKYEQEK